MMVTPKLITVVNKFLFSADTIFTTSNNNSDPITIVIMLLVIILIVKIIHIIKNCVIG